MDDIQLITLVESNAILYDKKRSDYKNKNKQNKAWQNIADTMGHEVEHVKNRWLRLRQRFSRERLKMASGAEAAEEWVLLRYMWFLDGIVKERKSISYFKQAKQAASSKECTINNTTSESDPLLPIDKYAGSEEESEEIFSPTSSNDVDFVTTPSGSCSAKPIKRPAKYATGEPPQKQTLTTLQTSLHAMNTLMPKKQEVVSTADPDDIFGQFVASRLKLMDEAEKKEKMKDIFNILMS